MNETKKDEADGNDDECENNKEITSMDLLDDYIEELKSLFGDLRRIKGECEQKAVITNNGKAMYEAILNSVQKLLEIVHFEIFYSDSKLNKYGYFQEYTRYKEEYRELCCIFSTLRVDNNSNNNNINKLGKDVNEKDSTLSPGNLFVDETGNFNGKTITDENNKKSLEYLRQGRRLLEETNQYGQQVLLNLNTQREQLKEAEKKVNTISHTLEDSSLILDRMTKWWHKLI
ncbi:hypothetical protein FG379_002400 [Cryptosporidium bovis]|uniref:uncharacterized protein n=1 Tax=Cryptosporidium bovis TaxID=310047 RepID=UPI00351A9A1E|nr:hypothetical protein FG379_002400 [Cryptosporidium bovis]